MDAEEKLRRENEDRVAEEYLSSLSDLTCNSKPLINMLTMLAEENIDYASVIVKVVEQHIAKVSPDFKLPILYLIDSIIKNVKSSYVQLFSQCIVNIFCDVFEQVNEKTRERMYALRQTWMDVFLPQKLYSLDVRVKRLDQNWPITAKPPSIHVNPDFLKTVSNVQTIPAEVGKILQDKTRELLELKKIKLELELEATKKHLEQENQLSKSGQSIVPPVEALVAANALQTATARALSTQIMPNMIPTNYVAHTQPRPDIMYANRAYRPHLHPPLMNIHHGGIPMSSFLEPNSRNANADSNHKIHPVNPSMVNTMRHRDPRLLRQFKQQSQQRTQHSQQLNRQQQQHSPSDEIDQDKDKGKVEMDKETFPPNATKSDRSNKRSGKISSSRRSSSSEKTFGRDKGKNRSKRSASKSSTTSSSSSASSNISSERKNLTTTITKNNDNNTSTSSSTSTSCDKDAFEIAPLSKAFKKKSFSTKHSSDKSRVSKSHTCTLDKNNRSRSNSPKKERLHDTDLRQGSTSNSIERTLSSLTTISQKKSTTKHKNEDCLSVSTKNLDKKTKAFNRMDVDLRQSLIVPSSSVMSTSIVSTTNLHRLGTTFQTLPTALSKAATITIDLTTTTTSSHNINSNELSANHNKATLLSSSPKVVFKIEKFVNKLEKSTENFTATFDKEHEENEEEATNQCDDNVSKYMDDDDDETSKKRSSDEMIKDNSDEPLSKKTKSATLEDKLFGSPELFGSEDVDLRQLMPVMSSSKSKDEKTSLSHYIKEKASPNQSDNWDNFKGETSKVSTKKTSSDDVRAKLSKTAKLNVTLKSAENINKELNEGHTRLDEFRNTNEDTQEMNDEKIRTMISQAQELLESKSITKEQHTSLLQTVMSINEANKLKIAKHQESLNAAREAVLKKRIPKLSKTTSATTTTTDEQQSSSKSDDSPRYDNEGGDIGDEKPTPRPRLNRDKQRFNKATKWSDRPKDAAAYKNNMWSPVPLIRPWTRCVVNNRPFLPGINAYMRLQCPPYTFVNGIVGGYNDALPHGMPNMAPPFHPSVIKNPRNSIDNPQNDIVRTITIDGAAKEIRFYDKVAIVFMDGDQPHEISFPNGQRTIYIDNQESVVLKFNEDYKPVTIGKEIFHMRFGLPSRELYIDEHWYEIYFGGPPVTIPIRNNIHMLRAEGPPPQVNIGALRRDLVVGKINMIVDAQNVVPLFLDARLQTFRLGNIEHTIQFADNLLTVLLDGTPTRVEYGGLPKSYFLKGKKYFIRFSALPRGIVAGEIQIKDMIYIETQPPIMQHQQHMAMETNFGRRAYGIAPDIANTNRMMTNEIPPKLENFTTNLTTSSTTTTSTTTSTALNNINIDELFQKLVSTGILNVSSNVLSTNNKVNAAECSNEPEAEVIKPIDLSKSESIRTRQSAIINVLYSGIPCSMCGIRFPQTNKQTNKYSQHLNWHYRQKRRERDMLRKVRSRKWYYDLNNWVQYEEVDDEDELASKNFFETQKNEAEIADDSSNQRSLQSPLPSCPAGPANIVMCDMCHENFEQVFNHDSEEWELPGAIRVEDRIYHPLCYEDFKASINSHKNITDDVDMNNEDANIKEENDGVNNITQIQIDDDNAVDMEIVPDQKIGGHTTKDEEDDDVIVLPNEEPSVTEIVDDDDDDDEYDTKVLFNKEPEQSENVKEDINLNEENMNESDVEIQEPYIPFTDLDTYKENETNDDSTQIPIMQTKIKEEPKGDDDEDDGFEDVGTVLIGTEEISIQSSEDHSLTRTSGMAEQFGSTISNNIHEDEIAEMQPMPTHDEDLSKNENLENGIERTLSLTCPTPTMPLNTLINKIKINITKNTSSAHNTTTSNNNNNSSTSVSASNSSATATENSNINVLNNNNNSSNNEQISLVVPSSNPIPTISTIPVLCSGGTTISSIMTNSFDGDMCLPSPRDNCVSTISVIGTNYVSGSSTNTKTSTVTSKTNSIQLNQTKLATPTAIEDNIQYEFKPALQKVTLKKKEKIICGSETSGLCSIM